MQRITLSCVCGLLLLLNAGCSQTSAPKLNDDPRQYLVDELFLPMSADEIETEQEIFALPDYAISDMKRMVKPLRSAREKTDALLNYIFFLKGKSITYDNSATLTATETLARHQANCLSLTILAYSLSKMANLDVTFQDVQIPEYWTHVQGVSLLNGHVNLKVSGGSSQSLAGQLSYEQFGYVIDFDLETNKSHFPVHSLKKPQIVAMFYNNKAAQAMIAKNYDLAYAYFKAAVLVDPNSSESWNNIAVLYRMKDRLDLAEQLYLIALRLDPESINSKSNLALLYQLTGKMEKSAELQRSVLKQRLENPYYHIMLGNEAMQNQELHKAIRHFQYSLKLNDKGSEAMAGLAKAYYQLGEPASAERYLLQAKRFAPGAQERARYQSKLQSLQTAAKQY
jgi:Flp pilus assembly protein TadD